MQVYFNCNIKVTPVGEVNMKNLELQRNLIQGEHLYIVAPYVVRQLLLRINSPLSDVVSPPRGA